MKKIELKYLAAYLPYGLKILDVRMNTVIDVTSINTNMNLSENFKLILRPLTDLTEQMSCDCGFPGNDGIKAFIGYIKSRDISIKIWDDLLNNNYDVFGLIEQGLAIDINTLNP